MNTEPKLVSIIGEKPLPKYYVYYDEWSGDIINVANRYKESKYPHLLTEDNTAAEILMGHLDPKKFIVNESVDGSYIVPKRDALRINAEEDHLSKIAEIPHTYDSEINIIRYINSWKLEINISQDTVYKMTGKRNNKKFSKKQNVHDSKISFFITARNNPLHLVKTIEIDPIDLINKGYKLYDVSDLQTVIGLNDIDIMTKRVFKSYGLKTKQNYVTLEYIKRKNARRNHMPISDDPTATFTISDTTAGWVLKSNFEEPAEHKIYGDITVHITGNSPFEHYDTVKIPITEIGHGKEFFIKTDANLRKSKILIGEEGKYLSFNYKGIEYVKSGKY